MRQHIIYAATVVTVAALLSGCGSKSEKQQADSSTTTTTTTTTTTAAVNIGDIETRVARQIEKDQTGYILQTKVTCPPQENLKAGSKIDCDVAGQAGTGTGATPGAAMTGKAHVTLKDDAGDEIGLVYKVETENLSVEGTTGAVAP